MNDLLRKHGKVILAFVGVLLMVIWMYNPSNNSNSGAETAKVVRGTLGGKNITNGDLRNARNDVAVLTKLSQFLRPQFEILPREQARGYERLVGFLQGTLNQDQGDLHFYLLVSEAKKFGLSPTADDVRQLKSELQLNNAETIQAFDKSMEIQYATLEAALGDYALIMRLEGLAMGGLQPSLPEIEYLADQSMSRVSIRYHVFSGLDLVPGLAAPTAEQIKAQVEAYKGQLAVSVTHEEPATIKGHQYPFGYKYPDRVKLEYLAFNRDEIVKMIHPGPKEWKDAFDYYNAHQADFTETPVPDAAGPLPRVKGFDEVKDQLVKREVDQAAEKLLDQMVKAAQASAAGPWKEVDEAGYHKLIDRSRWLGYAALAGEIKQRFGYEPRVMSSDEWLNANVLRMLPGIGEAMVINDNRRMGDFATAALHVREIEAVPAQPWMHVLQVGVEGPVLWDLQAVGQGYRKNNAYLYRVTDASKSHEPATELEMMEVGEQAKADLMRLASFEEYQKRGEQLAQEAAKSSLAEVGREKKLGTEETSFARLSMYLKPVEISGLGVQPKFADACFELAARSKLAPGGAMAASGPATMAGKGGAATGMIPIEAQLKAVVVEVTKYEPIPVNELNSTSQRDLYIYLTTMPKAQAFVGHWTSANAVAERMSFVASTPFKAGRSAE